MGKLSFEIYALHWPIMLSFEAGLFIVLKKYMEMNEKNLAFSKKAVEELAIYTNASKELPVSIIATSITAVLPASISLTFSKTRSYNIAFLLRFER